ncbi:hypothetical protein FQN55_005939 [Onygenales sp. PD_40]|nr:hypothetical protein FQN55_005939 [Onygenales sp. PD_40]KAK2787908.1 hypothetical protein FQN53_004349 [Emmonsiellopsis sp. PD_33]KAK2791942.1 hypothetical protein FQN52_004384 [Onygenales sp. PD_12]
MSSGFVSAGTTEDPPTRDEEWLKAQQELEAERRRKAEEGKQDGGKSLYEILQQNKAAKQDAFEESIKLKNQFRSLDDDEVEFLDSVLESTRAQEAALKRETMEQLEVFHRQRQQMDKTFIAGTDISGVADSNGTKAGSPPDEEQWTTSGRKRRRGKDKEALPGVKLRKSSSTDVKSSTISKASSDTASRPAQSSPEPEKDAKIPGKAETKHATETSVEQTKPRIPATAPTSSALGLGAYSSDDD